MQMQSRSILDQIARGRIVMEGDGGAGAGGAGAAGAAGGAAGAGAGDAGGAQGSEKLLSQAEVDRIVQERLARAPKVPEDYEALKARAAEMDALEAKNSTELEKAQKAAADADKARQTAEQEREVAKADAAEARKRVAVVAAASKLGAVNGDQVFALLPKDAVTIGDDGQVTGAEKAVKTFIEANPHFVGKPTRPAPDGSQGARGEPASGRDAGISEAQRRFGDRRNGAVRQ